MRRQICLNGEWDFMPVYNVKSCLDIPEKLAYEKEKIRVPSSWRYVTLEGTPYFKSGFGIVNDFEPFNMFEYPREWNRAETGVYHRTFSIPADMLTSRIFLRFDGMTQMSGIFLNGQRVAVWDEAYLPLRVDVTGYIKRDGSENDLIVVCTTFEDIRIPSGQIKSLGLIGSWYGYIGRGIWQDVFVESCPDTLVEDVYINTSVRNKTIDVKVDINNKSNRLKNLSLEAYISDIDGIVKTFSCDKIKAEPDNIVNVDLQEKWENPSLWMPDSPHLYDMSVVLYEDGKEIDNKCLRFGFREIWTEKSKLILNGTSINLRGDAWHFQGAIQQSKEYALNWYKMCKENGINFVRLHAEPFPGYYLDAADEVGMLIMDETAIYGSAKSMPADHPVYLDRCKKHIERLAKRDRNHPSVIVWSIQNEMRWVDGRDEFKRHIPEMMRILKDCDDTRPIILEGDNRLISKEDAEIDSMHYNIDGTIEQWEKKHPLFFGEHGGWWYICPQNSSAYAGLKAYLDVDECSEGMALKEKLFVEYARRKNVTGISTFNLAHYMMKSMPEEDVRLEWDRLDTPGCKPKVLRKHSLTVNNGMLEGGHPLYMPGVSLQILMDSYKQVVIIPSEYNSSFYDDEIINRSFDIYNDTLHTQNCKINFSVRQRGAGIVFEETFEFIQEPAERENVKICINPPGVAQGTELFLEAVLYHDGTEMFRLNKTYKIYPSILKHRPLDSHGKSIAYWGGELSHGIIKTLLPSYTRIQNVNDVTSGKFEMVIIGSYMNEHADQYQNILENYIEKGGVVVVLEQFKFVPGNLTLSRQSFFSAHINDSSHRILEGLNDKDLIFWKPDVGEDSPGKIIEQCFRKPVKGDVNMLLECSAGDFGDGGDFWTPLFEYRYKKGTMIFNQLELVYNYNDAPQACILLRNILEYALSLEPRVKAAAALLSSAGSPAYEFVKKTGLDFDIISSCNKFKDYDIVVLDLDSTRDIDLIRLSGFVKEGGKVLILPVQKDKKAVLESLLGCPVKIENVPVYQLNRTGNHKLIKGVSVVDLFRFEKVKLSPRLVENIVICENTIEVKNAENILVSVNGTPWYDYFVKEKDDEYSRIAIADINKKNKKEDRPYLVGKKYGDGSFIISQVSMNAANEKDLRIYSRVFANLGCFINSDIFTYYKGDRDYSTDYFMTLPHEEYKDYCMTEEYYSDKDFSLNNLGEGLYGWMKKVEKDTNDGFINVLNSSGRTFFLSCFADNIKDNCSDRPQPDFLECRIELDINCSFKLWINGKLMRQYSKNTTEIERIIIDGVVLIKGINRFIIAARANAEDIRFRPIFKQLDGAYMDNIKYQLTIDEVDPK